MVMETPSAQCVGREFVRQYYTLLHEAPLHLHRFYSHNSCFVHGGVEKPGEEQPPVQGQADIHKKICSLNFRDCHAKIRQVDSQATVGNAVVVQVTGELSNNGQPMRRFMQTFVLVPQSPKKYYVHNDIFRYQDEVFHDNDTDTENPDEAADSESETEVLEASATGDSSVPSFYDRASPQPMSLTFSNGTTHVEETVESPAPVSSKAAVSDAADQGIAPGQQQEKTPEPEVAQPARIKDEAPPAQQPAGNAAPSGKESNFDEKQAAPESKQSEPEPEPQPTGPPQPVTWAAMISRDKGVGNSAPMPPAGAIPSKPPSVMPSKPAETKTETSPAPQPQRAPRVTRERGGGMRGERDGSRTSSGGGPSGPPGGSMGDRGPPGMGGESDDPRRSRYPDSHQIFVGNLPHNTTETDLRSFFGQYGKVVESRINKKGGGNPHNVPNFGFVVFEDEKSVANVLSQRGNLTLPGGHRLNVEEKKQRGETGRPGSGTRQGRGGMMGGRGGGMDRGGPRGGRGGMGPGGRGQDSRGRGSYAPRR